MAAQTTRLAQYFRHTGVKHYFVPSTELNSLIRKLDSRGTWMGWTVCKEEANAINPINKTSTEGSTRLQMTTPQRALIQVLATGRI